LCCQLDKEINLCYHEYTMNKKYIDKFQLYYKMTGWKAACQNCDYYSLCREFPGNHERIEIIYDDHVITYKVCDNWKKFDDK